MERILPADVTVNILSRLPTESIYHCKQVCKTWRNLINYDQLFAQKYQSRVYEQNDDAAATAGKISFLFYGAANFDMQRQFYYAKYAPSESCMRFTRIGLIPMDESRIYRILGSCNGLICISSDIEHKSFMDKPMYICNPLTKEYLLLPRLNDITYGSSDYFRCGFGYVPSRNEYKVVKIHKGRVYVYTLGSGRGWRYIRNITYKLDVMYLNQCVFVNGALHWVESTKGNIVAFDLEEERFSMISSTPPCFINNWPLGTHHSVNYQLRVLGGSLCIVHKYGTLCDIWSLKDGDKGTQCSHWSKYLSTSDYPTDAKIFAITKDDEVLFLNGYTFYRHDLRQISDKKLECLDEFRHSKPSEVLLHVNSFVSLKALGEKDTKILELTEGR